MKRRPLLLICSVLIILLLASIQCNQSGSVKQLYETKCGHCHSSQRALSLSREPGALSFSIERMVAKDPNWITKSEKEIIEAYLIRETVIPVARLMETQCGACHKTDRFADLDLSAFQWAYLTDACRGRVGSRIGVDQAGRILQHIHSQPPPPKSDRVTVLNYPVENDVDLFLVTCAECHSAYRLRDPRSSEEWDVILPRMQNKNPILVTEERLAAARRYIMHRAKEGHGPWPIEAYKTLKDKFQNRLMAKGQAADTPTGAFKHPPHQKHTDNGQ